MNPLQAKVAQLQTLRQGSINWMVLIEEILAEILAQLNPTPAPTPTTTETPKS